MDKFNTVQQMEKLMAVARGKEEGDLLIRNVRILDVFTEQIFDGEILIKDGKIASIASKPTHRAKEVFDAGGRIAVPGFMDVHFHLDFPLVTPDQLSYAIVPHGTTALMCEILDYAALNGLEGAKGLVKDADCLPYHCLWAAPGKVAPKFITEEVLKWDNTVALGEMAQGKMEHGDPDELHKIELSRRLGKTISGHAVRRAPEELDIFAILGYDDEHNTDTYEETVARMRFGMSKIIRLNSAYDAAKSIITGALRDNIPTDQMLFAVDDIYITEVFRSGHLDRMIQRCIDLGLPAIKAIKIATINAARHFHLEHMLGSITPGRYADIVLLDDLKHIVPKVVFQKGRKVAEDGKLVVQVKIDYQELEKDFVPGFLNLREEELHFGSKDAKTESYTLKDDTPVQKNPFTLPAEAENEFYCDPVHDYLPFYRIERYPAFQPRKVEKKVICGTEIRGGAIAISFEQGGSAVCVTGDNIKDILVAAKDVDQYAGGISVVKDGAVMARFELPLGGSLSKLGAYEAAEAFEKVEKAVKQIGCHLNGAIQRMYFLPFYF